MNFLAHLYLAGDDEELIVGQMLGDFLEPGWQAHTSERVQLGVRRHQRIDAFTDQHPIVLRSKARFEPPFRRYAGVLLDVFHDHFLARRWDEVSPAEPLPRFAARCYGVLERNEAILTARLRRILPSLVAHDWLTSYGERAGVERALLGISRRLTRENPLPRAIGLLDELGPELKADFDEFWPEVVANHSGAALASEAGAEEASSGRR